MTVIRARLHRKDGCYSLTKCSVGKENSFVSSYTIKKLPNVPTLHAAPPQGVVVVVVVVMVARWYFLKQVHETRRLRTLLKVAGLEHVAQTTHTRKESERRRERCDDAEVVGGGVYV